MGCDERIYPPRIWYADWAAIPGLPGYEINPGCLVRVIGDRKVPSILLCADGLLQVGNHFYSIVDLMMLAYIGPKPHGFTVQKRAGGSRDLSNLFYGPEEVPEETGV